MRLTLTQTLLRQTHKFPQALQGATVFTVYVQVMTPLLFKQCIYGLVLPGGSVQRRIHQRD